MAIVRRRTQFCAIWFLLPCISHDAQGFSVYPRPAIVRDRSPSSALAARRYGPPVDDDDDEPFRSADPETPSVQPGDTESSQLSASLRRKTEALQALIQKIRAVKEPEHIPSLLTRHVDFILGFAPEEMSAALEAIRGESQRGAGADEGDPATATVAPDELEAIVDLILSFAQGFCDEAAAVYDTNRRLLGRIMKAMKGIESGSGETGPMDPETAGAIPAPIPIHSSGRERKEDALDRLLIEERSNLTPGFVRHLAAECERIENAPGVTPESLRMLEYLRTIQARVVEEMGRDLGEPAQVIMQLLGYDGKGERMAVLEAGLVVRGTDFASELLASTKEALEGFQAVPGGADPELMERVREIHDRTRQFIQDEAEVAFQ